MKISLINENSQAAKNGILASVLLNSGAADFVVTGCGTWEGAVLALNGFGCHLRSYQNTTGCV